MPTQVPGNSLRLSDVLSREELRRFTTSSDLLGAGFVAFSWLVLIAAFAMAILWPNPLTIIASILLIGGRQLALSVLMHDCSHKSLFASEKANDFVGHFLCGGPLDISVYDYRDYHLQHHKHAGTPQDPDIIFVQKYPISKASLRRKLMRDLTGRTGFRDTLARLSRFNLSKSYPWVLFHIALISAVTLAGAPWAYLLWWAAELTVYPAVLRIRQIGEHGVATDRTSLDPRENTSTTIPNLFERLMLAPANVNYHLEHHQFAHVPPYHLPGLHRLLNERGYYDGYRCISTGYRDVLRNAVRQDGADGPSANDPKEGLAAA